MVPAKENVVRVWRGGNWLIAWNRVDLDPNQVRLRDRLRALSWAVGTPGLASWETFSRPFGTGLAPNLYPAPRAGLSSTVPSGLVPIVPWPVACPVRAVYSSSSERANLDKLFSNRMKKEDGGREYGNCRVNHEPANTAGDKFFG